MTLSWTAAIALRTTGQDPHKDRLLEICVEMTGGEGENRRVNAGIDPAAPDGDERSAAAVIARLAAGAPPGTLWIAHDGTHAHTFLTRAAPDGFGAEIIDSSELSRICFPSQLDYDLPALCEQLGVRPLREDTLAATCGNTLRLWNKLQARIAGMPPSLLRELAQLYTLSRGHPFRKLFKAAADRAAGAGATPTPLRELFSREAPPPRRQLTLAEVRTPLAPAAVREVFEPLGPLSRRLPGYEVRPQQAAMAEAVAVAFNQGRCLMVEAGTGVGKSLAYLVPAVLWAAANEVPVVVSTSAKNLQSQLLDKDIPLLTSILGMDFKAVVIKGRRNYLCLRKLLFLLRHADVELDKRERAMLAAILVWAVHSTSGEIAECSACASDGGSINESITSAGGECHGPRCDCRQRCFLYRARRKAQAADIVIANHAVVLAEVHAGDESAVLPPHRQIILDEAHNLEDAATTAFSVEISSRRLGYLMGRLWRSGGRKGGHGLIPLLLQQFEAETQSGVHENRVQVRKALAQIVDDQALVWASADAFLGALGALMPDRAARGSLRLQADRREPAQWDPILERKRPFVAALGGVARAIDTVLAALRSIEEERPAEGVDFAQQLQSVVDELREFMTDTDFVLEARDPEYVYWAERLPPRYGGACAWAAPITVGGKLHDLLYAQKESVVMTSATLSVNGSLAYIKKRLGVDRLPPERLGEVVLGSPFEYERQCLAMTPTFLPEPDDGQGGYAEALARLLADVFRLTSGRAMGLFTSYEMLARVAAALRRDMAGSGITILVQGESGSREAILDSFKTADSAVLLGTHSFWEGVDVVGEALSCLVVARLPFAVFTDPIVEARCQQVEAEGESAFMGYSVPAAVIRLRQGFGRLIRSRGDRGVVVIADRRIVSRRYGQWFRGSLPLPVRAVPERDAMLSLIESFFDSEA